MVCMRSCGSGSLVGFCEGEGRLCVNIVRHVKADIRGHLPLGVCNIMLGMEHMPFDQRFF